uniref:Putative secreted peptide n=1 Tax=Anopheles braziliensis TaxID=58242 RepID=A0A2M3ZUQ0_9DIPT
MCSLLPVPAVPSLFLSRSFAFCCQLLWRLLWLLLFDRFSSVLFHFAFLQSSAPSAPPICPLLPLPLAHPSPITSFSPRVEFLSVFRQFIIHYLRRVYF